MLKELWLGQWCAYIAINKPRHFKFGGRIGLTELDVDLFFVSFGIWR